MKINKKYNMERMPQQDHTHAIQDLWSYLSSWKAEDGGINGPVVHRCDLKRLWKVHDTAWTQAATIEGLITLYKRSNSPYWLNQAMMLADAQCDRQEPDGSYKWAGHEDDRFSSLVSNAMADCALLDVAEVLKRLGRSEDSHRYLEVVRDNINGYFLHQLYSEELGGFKVNPVDYYTGTSTFIIDMNSLAVEVLIRYYRLFGTEDYAKLATSIGRKILYMQCRTGLAEGAFSYSHLELRCFVTIYTALTLRGVCQLYYHTREGIYRAAVELSLRYLERMKNCETGLWRHRLVEGRLHTYPLFVAGAGIVGNALLDASLLIGMSLDPQVLVSVLLSYQLPNGAIRNFIGYDHTDNSRFWATNCEVWEDIYPTPNWNAHAFSFFCRVLPLPTLPFQRRTAINWQIGLTLCYFECKSVSLILGFWPPTWTIAACFIKRWRYGLVLPGVQMGWRWLKRVVLKFTIALLRRANLKE